ncbi:hypothetical protein GCM10017691_38630 [Pseudonocardia petroleophila]
MAAYGEMDWPRSIATGLPSWPSLRCLPGTYTAADGLHDAVMSPAQVTAPLRSTQRSVPYRNNYGGETVATV